MEVMKGVDLKKYMGLWYEIARIKSKFQPKDGVNTRTIYTLRKDGETMNVLNETWTPNGKRGSIEGIAYKSDPKSVEAKLKIKFMVPPFMPVFPVFGDYWILHLDDNYHYALIGQPSRNSLWILCRENRLDEEIYKMLVKKAADEGYDTRKVCKTYHTEPPP
ncbi:temperature-induced lipocalin-1-like [Impatiens glandulifera]|uniref:temperature-induced lipocalin-1-like n=1 Tax=Impatiens glandulifera TaxID=253017 RepID=UPI001FB0A094|nr:temperature-induced lipocalin-1-like [Impatiens glandulifera]